jgi:hypothetical protein
MEARMKRLTLALLLACMGLAGCVVVPAAARYDREVYVAPQASTTYYPAYTYRYYGY